MKNEIQAIDWKNVDLKSGYERSQNILEPYDFETLLLEISCNIRAENLTEEVITKHFNDVLQAKVAEAKSIFSDNLKNIMKVAKLDRED